MSTLHAKVLALFFCCLASGAAMAGQYTVGLCVMGMRHPYFRDMADQFVADAARRDVAVTTQDADFNHLRQVGIIEDFIKEKVDMIVVAPFDAKAIVPTLTKARDAGIPVMTVDTEADWKWSVSHVASDNTAGGRLAAGMMLERLREMHRVDKGVILGLEHRGATSTNQRIKGFTDIIALRGGGYRVAAEDVVGQRAPATAATRKILASEGANLEAIFAANDGATLGALDALEAAGRLEDVLVIGFDYDTEAMAAIDAGKIAGCVIQFPRKIGGAALEIVHDYLTGKNKKPPKQVLVEVGTYTVEGVQDQRGNRIPYP